MFNVESIASTLPPFNIQHSAFNIEPFSIKKGSAAALPQIRRLDRKLSYERSPFSCSSWQSMQNGVQGTAARRFSPMVAPQFVQVP